MIITHENALCSSIAYKFSLLLNFYRFSDIFVKDFMVAQVLKLFTRRKPCELDSSKNCLQLDGFVLIPHEVVP